MTYVNHRMRVPTTTYQILTEQAQAAGVSVPFLVRAVLGDYADRFQGKQIEVMATINEVYYEKSREGAATG